MNSRRKFLAATLAAASVGSLRHLLAQAGPPADLPGRRVGTLELGGSNGAPRLPVETLLGAGLDARLFTDLSTLTEDRPITPNDRFYVRTAFPATLRRTQPWTIRVGGLVREPGPLNLGTLNDLVGPRGAHLLECAGNAETASYGLISVAEWDGIPMAALLERIHPLAHSLRVLMSGVDDDVNPSRTSIPGASWIFSRDDLERASAFLATRMNGASLPRDHGSPVRLIVPGWYGCACIKWVDRIDVVDDAAPATSQMQEFAARTHQEGTPALARDFTPAVIDLAAMPVRVEKWAVDGHLVYRVVGVMWGGSKPTNALQIRFRRDEPFVPVSHCPVPENTRTWSVWWHLWRPASPRTYDIVLRGNDPTIRARRLDLFFYTREVTVDEV